MIIIDSDIVIDVLRKHPPALAWIASQPSAEFLLAGYSAIELYAGCRNAAQQHAVDVMLQRFRLAWPSMDHCGRALIEFRSLRLAHGIGAMDTLIAETAMELRIPLHTFNIKHFRHVRGLTTIQPYTR